MPIKVALLDTWLAATRPKTLPAAIVPVLLGVAMAKTDNAMQLAPASICLIFALLVQVGTNFANDYLDGIKGTDTKARLGPRRAVASGLISPQSMRRAAFFVLTLAFVIGLSLILYGGWRLLAVGVASVICAWIYTGGPYPLAYNGLGDVFVVLFFGLIAVGCTYFVQVGVVPPRVWLLGLGCGLVINNLLVVNNYRDIDEDRAANKRTLVVLFGRRWARLQYAGSLVFALGVVGWLGIFEGYWLTLLGAFPLLYGFVLCQRLATASHPIEFLASLKGASLVVIGFGFGVSFGLFLS